MPNLDYVELEKAADEVLGDLIDRSRMGDGDERSHPIILAALTTIARRAFEQAASDTFGQIDEWPTALLEAYAALDEKMDSDMPKPLDYAELEKMAEDAMYTIDSGGGRCAIMRATILGALRAIAKRAFEQAALGTNPLSVNLAALNSPKEPDNG